ncbi:ferric reductase [Rhodobacterales bacterium]|nr:ferric reductase [Rhodobacterales bacterium]
MLPSLRSLRAAPFIWCGLIAVMVIPIVIAAFSPYLAYRNFAYIVGGFAGIFALALFVIQPLLAAGYLPGARTLAQRRWHRWVGTAIITCVALHVGGLYLTSPPDTLDALLLVAPTPFSVYGVTAMWGIVLTALLVAFRRRLGIGPSLWRLLHNALALVVAVTTVIHALLIQGAMEPVSKWILCLAVLGSTTGTLALCWLVRFRSGKGIRGS